MSMKSKILSLSLALSIASLSVFPGCAVMQKAGNSVTAWFQNPKTQAGIEALEQAAFSFAMTAGLAAVEQLATTGRVDYAKSAMTGGAAALYTSASYIRQLQGTKEVLNASETARKLEEAGLPTQAAQDTAKIITDNAASLAAKGIPADKASEINASAFDAAALAIQSGMMTK